MSLQSSPISIRLEKATQRKLVQRAEQLRVSPGSMAKALLTEALNCDVELQLEGLRAEIASLQTAFAVIRADLRADLNQLNENFHEALKAILCGQTGDEDHAREMADELIRPLGGEG